MVKLKKILTESIGDIHFETPKHIPSHVQDLKSFLYRKLPSRSIVFVRKVIDWDYILQYPFTDGVVIILNTNEHGTDYHGHVKFSNAIREQFDDDIYGTRFADYIIQEYKKYKKNPSSIQPMSISDYIKLKNTPEYKKETEKYTKKLTDDFLKLVK